MRHTFWKTGQDINQVKNQVKDSSTIDPVNETTLLLLLSRL